MELASDDDFSLKLPRCGSRFSVLLTSRTEYKLEADRQTGLTGYRLK